MDGIDQVSQDDDPHGTGIGPILTTARTRGRSLTHQVFEKIRSSGRISRSDVAKDLGVSPGSVTAIVAGLMDAGFVRESPSPSRDTLRGRPPVDLTIIPEARFVIGVNMRADQHMAVVADSCGKTLAYAEKSHSAGRMDVPAMLEDLDELIGRVLKTSGLARNQISALGLGLPGFVDHAAGMVHWSPILRDRKVELRAALESRFPFSVQIDNDANLLAMAESWFGVGRKLSDFAVVTIEQGVGMGLILDNAIYRGALGLGLEIGHTTVQLDGALCRCGQRGCLEAYVADYALVREASTAMEWDPRVARSPQQALEMLFDQAKAGNDAARLIFNRAGRYLSLGLANVIRIFDPELLIISGARLRYDYLYAEEVLAEMHSFSDQIGRQRTRVEINTWGDLVWVRGAVAMALSAATEDLSAPARDTP
ncbi:ROK family transcriptional regulator [Pseudoruegeria sp. SK021]|uniref:ROK family transcriptional regulator n=1 Tax=Pseudoruegeria sp. SK021 TaxID=1933035 RepID=UPI000A23603C|nr:ROK family transcriptional regulator [Pseudoruegeria sp. SK021]OSP56617.1 XylR family transcriptional regulator [Pseudoruegeria sp. SK021]